jgi:hypothetical protein
MWRTLLPIAGNLISGILGNKSAKKAGQAQVQGLQQGIDTIGSYYKDAQGNLAPYMGAGKTGVSGLLGLLQDPNSIADSAAYQWRFGQGQDMLDSSAAARGGLFGGGHQKELVNYGQGLASQEYDNQWNRLFGLSNMGQDAATSLSRFGADAGRSIAEMYGAQGGARSSTYGAQDANTANMINSVAGGIGSLFGGNLGSQSPMLTQYGTPQQLTFGITPPSLYAPPRI